MDDVEWARTAATDALSDIDPAGLRRRAETYIDEGSTAPAVLTLVAARAVEPSIDRDAVAERAAGVQLIYEGLGLTRRLSETEPWTDPTRDSDEADLDVLVADVLVARGFYLLARTEAADRAVETVRSFGRNQTAVLEAPDVADEPPDNHLEESVFGLAAEAGATTAGEAAGALTRESKALASGYAGETLPRAGTLLDEGTRRRLGATVQDGEGSVTE
jgi:hypothetical protein